MRKKTIITYGTFDMFHIGHLNLLKNLKALGDELIVVVSTDDFNLLKGKKTLIPYDQRAQIVEAISYVDRVLPETSWEQKVEDVKKYNIDTFAIGDDWEGEFDFLKVYCNVVYLPRTSNISTTQLKKSLSMFLSIPKDDLIKAIEALETLKVDLS